MKLITVFVVCAGPVWADCGAGEQTFLSCDIVDSTKSLDACFDDKAAYYRFGERGKSAELALSEPIATLAFEPWSGVGRKITERITFHNAGYTYATYGGFTRWFGDDAPDAGFDSLDYGGVWVSRGEESIAHFMCDPETVEYVWGLALYDLKEALDQVWDDRGRRWVPLW